MPAAKVVIVTPAPPGSRAGNRNTAIRWARFLRDLGCRVSVLTQWAGEPCELLVALHARKSHDALRAFRESHPDRPAVLALTGTDIYRDIRQDRDAATSLEMATRLIVLQKEALEELTPKQRSKARVIHQSVTTSLVPAPPVRKFRLCVLGHLREEKDPFCAARALRLIPDSNVEIIQAGKALSAKMAREAERRMRDDSRYRWIGELPHWTAMRLLCRSHAMVISSRMEGGAHVVSEAIAIGIPVIATDIPGNRGLLGADYPAFFPVGDHAVLAGLLRQALSDPRFVNRLAVAVNRRRTLVDPMREQRAWRDLLRELGVRPV
jgi:putative glycosyltransferase (TIGR04348 family)